MAQVQAFTFAHDVVAYARESMTAVFVPLQEAPQGMQVPQGAQSGAALRWRGGGLYRRYHV